ncbi:hypothetical protein NKW54_15895, partial [Acetobacter cerevisiae]
SKATTLHQNLLILTLRKFSFKSHSFYGGITGETFPKNMGFCTIARNVVVSSHGGRNQHATR